MATARPPSSLFNRLRARGRGVILGVTLASTPPAAQPPSVSSLAQKTAIAAELNQAHNQARNERAAEVLEGLNKEPAGKFASLTPSLSPQKSTEEHPAQPTEISPSLEERQSPGAGLRAQASVSPLERRRIQSVINTGEREIAELENKTRSTRRREETNKIIREGIKMAATAETVLGLIYYLGKLIIIEMIRHKDGPQVKKLKRQIRAKKVELERLKRQARKLQLNRV
jgi:hypothetical protein